MTRARDSYTDLETRRIDGLSCSAPKQLALTGPHLPSATAFPSHMHVEGKRRGLAKREETATQISESWLKQGAEKEVAA